MSTACLSSAGSDSYCPSGELTSASSGGGRSLTSVSSVSGHAYQSQRNGGSTSSGSRSNQSPSPTSAAAAPDVVDRRESTGDQQQRSSSADAAGSEQGSAAGGGACASGQQSSGSSSANASVPRPPEKPLHPKLLAVTAQLEMKNLWDEFDSLGTEMIVTKAGR